MPARPESICDIHGLRVGHAHNLEAKTGCTVILAERGAVAGVDIRGSAPGTREIEAIKPVRLVPQIHAILLTGGSAFGLDAAGGVMAFLEEGRVGFDVGVTRVPIVPAAVIFDLLEGDHRVRPDKEMGYAATANASSESPAEGRVGAGAGATVGKVAGPANAMKGGCGTACERAGEILIGAIAVVNAFGDVCKPDSGVILAGARDAASGAFLNSERYLRENPVRGFGAGTNTTLAVVATDACFNKEEITKVAQMAQDGLARVIRPAHTMLDGDIVFALSLGDKSGDVTTVGTVAAAVVAQAIVRAVKFANQIT